MYSSPHPMEVGSQSADSGGRDEQLPAVCWDVSSFRNTASFPQVPPHSIHCHDESKETLLVT